MAITDQINSIAELEDLLSTPTSEVVAVLGEELDSDVMILGAGGKMGPTLAIMARRALNLAGSQRQVIAVSRFSEAHTRAGLEAAGVHTISCDLLDPAALARLPECPQIIYMAGMKFGASQAPELTWAMNVLMPGLAAARFPQANWVVFSSGNVYPLTPIARGGCTETDAPQPVGEYAMSVLGRERIFAHRAACSGMRCLLLRLNYAVELRYGVLLDIAQKVWQGEPIDLRMGSLNAIWQGDANAIALRCLTHTAAPPRILNVTGPETLSIRALAQTFGTLMEREPNLEGTEQAEALIANAAACQRLFGYPQVPAAQVMRWVADWVMRGGPTLNKPTKFAVRNGHY